MAKSRRTLVSWPVTKRRKTKHEERPVFDSIRKPTAPPAKKMGQEKPEEKLHPALRKVKHKVKLEIDKEQ